MIWIIIQEAKIKIIRPVSHLPRLCKCPVPHRPVKFAMDFFHIPARIQRMLMSYYNNFQMRFTTNNYITDWVNPHSGIPMGCTVSPVLLRGVYCEIVSGSRWGCSSKLDPISDKIVYGWFYPVKLSNPDLWSYPTEITGIDRVGTYSIQGQETKKCSPGER